MKRLLLAGAAALLLATGAHASSAYDTGNGGWLRFDFVAVNCDAPRVALGDDPGGNPVVKVEVKYAPADHAWRVFHHLASGLVVSRSEQYAINDATNDHKLQWQGSLIRNNWLYMIGEVQIDHESQTLSYSEWLYDRGKNNKLVMQSTADCVPVPTATSSPLPQPTN